MALNAASSNPEVEQASGARQVQVMQNRCKKCGLDVKQDDKFCGYCGEPVKGFSKHPKVVQERRSFLKQLVELPLLVKIIPLVIVGIVLLSWGVSAYYQAQERKAACDEIWSALYSVALDLPGSYDKYGSYDADQMNKNEVRTWVNANVFCHNYVKDPNNKNFDACKEKMGYRVASSIRRAKEVGVKGSDCIVFSSIEKDY